MNKQFEEWLIKNYVIDEQYNQYGGLYITDNEEWGDYPFSMQWGVYLEFFDSEGIYLHVDSNGEFYASEKYIHHNYYSAVTYIDRVSSYTKHKTRQEAQQEAIKKAFEILGK